MSSSGSVEFDQQQPELSDERDGPLSAAGMKDKADVPLVFDDFHILLKLGAGGMGAVYLAHQVSANRKVAVKVLFPRLARHPAYLERFRREARVMAGLTHPALVQLHGVGENHGLPFLVMEFIEGVSAATLMRLRAGPFSVGDALHMILRCAEALDYAHRRQVVHRDLTPANILVTRRGAVKIADMGLAKALDAEMSLTATGIGVGTPSYAAPEQARDAKHADHRSDIYSLGSVLYFCLTNALPFEGANLLDLIEAKERGRFAPVRLWNPQVPPRLEQVLKTMLAADPRQRYPSCAALIQDLENLHLAGDRLSFAPLQDDWN